MSPKEFMTRWINGMKNLTPAQQLHAKMVGQIGNIVGLIFAWVFLWLKGFWFFSISMAFVVLLLTVDFIGTRQQYAAACKIQDELKQFEILEEK